MKMFKLTIMIQTTNIKLSLAILIEIRCLYQLLV